MELYYQQKKTMYFVHLALVLRATKKDALRDFVCKVREKKKKKRALLIAPQKRQVAREQEKRGGLCAPAPCGAVWFRQIAQMVKRLTFAARDENGFLIRASILFFVLLSERS